MFFVQGLRWPCFFTQRGHYEPRVLALLQMFGLGHHPSCTAPTLPCLIDELFEQPRRATGFLVLGFRLPHLLLNLGLQTFVFRQPQQVVHAFRFTPRHQLLAAKSRVPAHHHAHLWPRRTNLCHDALQLFYTSRRGIDVRRSQPRTQQELSAKDVQRQIAIAGGPRLRDLVPSFFSALSDWRSRGSVPADSEYFSPPKLLGLDPTSPLTPPGVERPAALRDRSDLRIPEPDHRLSGPPTPAPCARSDPHSDNRRNKRQTGGGSRCASRPPEGANTPHPRYSSR